VTARLFPTAHRTDVTLALPARPFLGLDDIGTVAVREPTLISATTRLCAFPLLRHGRRQGIDDRDRASLAAPLRGRLCPDPRVGRGIGQEPAKVAA